MPAPMSPFDGVQAQLRALSGLFLTRLPQHLLHNDFPKCRGD
jgi:hypothetical protein